MIHPATSLVFLDDNVGYGVLATEPIPTGTVVWVRDRADRVYTPDELERLEPGERAIAVRLGYRDHLGQTIVCADAGRYVNHSCEPAMRGIGPDAMIAVRDIGFGDELTCDYAECNLATPLDCACQAPGCRRRIGGGDLARHASQWQVEVEAAITAAAGLAQPIVAHAIDRERIEAVLAGRTVCPPLADVQLRARI